MLFTTNLSLAFGLMKENERLANNYLDLAYKYKPGSTNAKYYLSQHHARLKAALRWQRWIAKEIFPIPVDSFDSHVEDWIAANQA